jgi:hypothetical protein
MKKIILRDLKRVESEGCITIVEAYFSKANDNNFSKLHDLCLSSTKVKIDLYTAAAKTVVSGRIIQMGVSESTFCSEIKITIAGEIE